LDNLKQSLQPLIPPTLDKKSINIQKYGALEGYGFDVVNIISVNIDDNAD
jgi:hypothetical protein